jgi:hypothetical protein
MPDPVPLLSVQVSATLKAWERAVVKIALHNPLTHPVLPLSVRLSTAEGVLEQWGIEGPITYWGQKVRGRKTAKGWEVLLGTELPRQQLASPPANLWSEATQELVRLEPVMPGASVVLQTYFDATYQLGDRLDATMAYLIFAAGKRPFWMVTEKPSRPSLVACQPVSELTADQNADFYLPADELARERRVLNASAKFSIVHPAFDIEQARQRTGITEGPFGYDIQSSSWILVDPGQRRTLVVGATGDLLELSGDWLTALLTLNSSPVVQIRWPASSTEEIERAHLWLTRTGIEHLPYSHKGHSDSLTLLVTITRLEVIELDRLIRETGSRLEGFQVTPDTPA